MTVEESMVPGESRSITANSVVIRVEATESASRSVFRRIVFAALVVSLMFNFMLLLTTLSGAATTTGSVQEKHHSGNEFAQSKLAIIEFSGTIMPPYTERWLEQLKQATEDEDVKGVLLSVDSPGGLVADSHQLYHAIQKLVAKKPAYVAMKRLAASGGYYLAMGIGEKGRIFVEPTTWTGSIGVIIPRYNAMELATKVGIKSEPLATGPLKDSLSPFRDLTDAEREVWDAILADAFDRFVDVIHSNRSKLSEGQVRALATGQIYTANQAIGNGLADEIGYEEEALTALAQAVGISDYRAIQYSSPAGLMDLLLGAKSSPVSFSEELLEAGVPKAMYYCSWSPWIPGTSR